MTRAFSPDWLAWPQTQKLLAVFGAAHVELCFVGGAVRDALAGEHVPFDIDCMSPATVKYIMTVAERAGFFHELRGPKADVVVMWVDGKRYDIAALGDEDRHEPFLTRVKLYLERQYDFTMDAVILTVQGELHDPFGGAEDLASGRVAFMRTPEAIFSDPMRILRYFRLVAMYGAGHADMNVVALAARMRGQLQQIVGWRRYHEVLKISMAPKGVRMLRLMAREWILPEALDFSVSDLQAFEHLVAIEGMLKIAPEIETRMILFSVLASINGAEAMGKLAQPMLWQPEMLSYHVWMVEQLSARNVVQAQWRETMGDQGYTRMVLAQWALEYDVMEAAPFFSALL